MFKHSPYTQRKRYIFARKAILQRKGITPRSHGRLGQVGKNVYGRRFNKLGKLERYAFINNTRIKKPYWMN